MNPQKGGSNSKDEGFRYAIMWLLKLSLNSTWEQINFR